MTAGHWIALGVTAAIVALAGVVVALLIREGAKPIPVHEPARRDGAIVAIACHPMA